MKVLTLEFIAGFLEGDGWIGLQKRKNVRGTAPNYLSVIAFSNTRKDLLLAVRRALKAKGITRSSLGKWQSTPRAKQGYSLAYTGRWALEVISVLEPLLYIKRRQARLVLTFNRTRRKQWSFGQRQLPQVELDKREKLYRMLRELNRRGLN